mmetsp:Transcript_14135/g.18330  ORF Transcript_14135/g.18330 Transcript_14135/m.18330 type:complete len:751 (-) Transcript_14135:151-2403(-)
MDLTTAERALDSLGRRQAPIEDIQAASKLRSCCFSSENPKQEAEKSTVESLLTQLIGSSCWESKAAGYISCAKIMETSCSESISNTFLFGALCNYVESDLEHIEPRVRSSVVKVLKGLASSDGPRTWERFGKAVFDSIERNLVVDSKERSRVMQEIYANELGKAKTGAGVASVIKPVVAHETVGWKALETSLRGLQSLIGGYGAAFVSDGCLTSSLVDLVTLKCLKHENRYVREVGFDLCSVMVQVLAIAIDGGLDAAAQQHDNGENSTGVMLDKLASAVGLGLSDNWSQVRYAASVAVRSLLSGLSEQRRKPYMDDLVPRMCLNRYYLAQGVKLYSQETWKIVFGDKGPQVVAEHADAVVAFYCKQCRADNHAVREAACYCIAELATKAKCDEISVHVNELLNALIDAFKDESWPVRDAACIATSNFISGFPNESKALVGTELYELWFAHLSDNIWSVREDSAIALGNVMRTYGDDAVEEVLKRLPNILGKVFDENVNVQQGHLHGHGHGHGHSHDNQESHVGSSSLSNKDIASSKYSQRASQPRGVVAGDFKMLSSKPDKYSNQQLYSCGSLAPKLRRGVGCMDHGFSRDKKLWEITDGGIYLLRELAAVKPEEAEKFLPVLAEIATFISKNSDNVEDFYNLQETLWKQLIPISKSLGKRPFKRYIELFLKPMILALECERKNQLCAHAAAQCIEQLELFLGKSIFRGRIAQLDVDAQRLLDIFDRNQHLIHVKTASMPFPTGMPPPM